MASVLANNKVTLQYGNSVSYSFSSPEKAWITLEISICSSATLDNLGFPAFWGHDRSRSGTLNWSWFCGKIRLFYLWSTETFFCIWARTCINLNRDSCHFWTGFLMTRQNVMKMTRSTETKWVKNNALNANENYGIFCDLTVKRFCSQKNGDPHHLSRWQQRHHHNTTTESESKNWCGIRAWIGF